MKNKCKAGETELMSFEFLSVVVLPKPIELCSPKSPSIFLKSLENNNSSGIIKLRNKYFPKEFENFGSSLIL